MSFGSVAQSRSLAYAPRWVRKRICVAPSTFSPMPANRRGENRGKCIGYGAPNPFVRLCDCTMKPDASGNSTQRLHLSLRELPLAAAFNL